MNNRNGSFIKRIRKKYFNPEKSIRLVLFNIVILSAIAFGFPTLLIMHLRHYGSAQVPTTLLSIITAVVCFIIANKYGKINLASSLIIGVVTLVLFPIMYFMGGAVFGGMPLYFALGVIFLFMLVEGKAFYVLLFCQFIVYGISFYYAYAHPESVTALGSTEDIYVDVFQSTLVVSFAIGVINKYQTRIYNRVLNQINVKNKELQESEKEAERANMAKSEFLSNMSHEIRTPINAIIGMNEMIRRESTDPEITGYASVANNSANALLSIINDILDFSKIESGKLEIINKRYELSSLITDCFFLIRDRAKDKGLEVSIICEPTLPCALNGDIVRIRQIIVNLLTNAVKYTDRGSVKLTVSGDINGQKMNLKISVIDTGIGMRKEDIDKMYIKFQRLDMERNQTIEGTGLGMSIVKELLELMGGELEVVSEYGVGSRFSVVIPQLIEDERQIGNLNFDNWIYNREINKYKPGIVASSAKVLVVDDVNINLIVFKNLIKGTGIGIDTALSGREALNMIKNTKYDIIFMDHMMPEMSGVEVFNELKADKTHANIDTPVIMLTANATSGVEEEYLKMGFDGYMSKPIDMDILEEILGKFIKNTDEKDLEETVVEESKVVEERMTPIDIDIEAGIANCGGEQEFYAEVVESVEEEDKRGELLKAYADEDWEMYTIVVHSLKGTLRLLGAMGAGKLAENLQFAGEKVDVDYINTHHDAFIKAMDESMSYIKANI